jgi:hypothetical protein
MLRNDMLNEIRRNIRVRARDLLNVGKTSTAVSLDTVSDLLRHSLPLIVCAMQIT